MAIFFLGIRFKISWAKIVATRILTPWILYSLIKFCELLIAKKSEDKGAFLASGVSTNTPSLV